MVRKSCLLFLSLKRADRKRADRTLIVIGGFNFLHGIKKLNLTHIGVMILLNFVILLKYSNLKKFTTYHLLIQFVNLNNMC